MITADPTAEPTPRATPVAIELPNDGFDATTWGVVDVYFYLLKLRLIYFKVCF